MPELMRAADLSQHAAQVCVIEEGENAEGCPAEKPVPQTCQEEGSARCAREGDGDTDCHAKESRPTYGARAEVRPAM